MAAGTLTNLAAGTISITADVSALNVGGGDTIGNAGLLRKTTTPAPRQLVVQLPSSTPGMCRCRAAR